MCSCCVRRRLPNCPCPCHWSRIIGGTGAGKISVLLWLADRARFEREHPNGVVQGQVVTDSGEIEA